MTTTRKKEPKSKPTLYVVFRVNTITEAWEYVGDASTRGAHAAILAVANQAGDYRAVPRSNITELALAQEPKLVPVDRAQLALVPDDPETAEKAHAAITEDGEFEPALAIDWGEEDGA